MLDRKRVVDMWAAEDVHAEPDLKSFFVQYYKRALEATKGVSWRGRSVLLTYNGS